MSVATVPALERRIRQARRRLVLQTLLNRLVGCWALALTLALGWLVVQPLAYADAPESLRWIVLGSLMGLGTLAAVVWTVRTVPSRLVAALSLDQRFELRERVTTALSLSPADLESPAGQALIADANYQAEQIDVRSRFPLRLGRRSLLIPIQAVAVVLLALFPPRFFSDDAAGAGSDDGKGSAAKKADAKDPLNLQANAQRPPIRKPPERANKSEALKQLEADLEKLYAEANKFDKQDKPEQLRDKVEEITGAEEKLKKFASEQAEKFQRLQEQMQKLGGMEQSEALKDGPARDFQKALQQGDVEKAKQAIDELQKKVKEKKLSEKDKEQLEQQLKAMAEKLDRAAKNEEQKKKLQDLVNQAKKEGRNAEALERELKRLEQESAQNKELQDLAKKLSDCKKCMEQKDFDGLADKLNDVSKDLQNMADQMDDLGDLDEHLQNLKEMRNRMCKQCQGEGEKEGECDNEGEKDFAKGKGRASGKRPENPDAKTNEGPDARQRGRFDPRGRKSYAGAVNGPAFTKKTSVEMAGEIQQAVQEAPEAVEVQRLPKAARDMVREYFEKLGGQEKK